MVRDEALIISAETDGGASFLLPNIIQYLHRTDKPLRVWIHGNVSMPFPSETSFLRYLLRAWIVIIANFKTDL